MLTTEPVPLIDCTLKPSGVVKFLDLAGKRWGVDLDPPHAENTPQRVQHLVRLYTYLSGIFECNPDPHAVARSWLEHPSADGSTSHELLADGTEESARRVLYRFEDTFLRP